MKNLISFKKKIGGVESGGRKRGKFPNLLYCILMVKFYYFDL